MNRLESMLIVLGEVLDCKTSNPSIKEMLNHPAITELDGLRRVEANFLVALYLAYIHAYRTANAQRGTQRHVIVFDEASRLFYMERQYSEVTAELGSSLLKASHKL